ncbi:MAG: hypothetical protein Q9217_004041 [Psora testacea]
MRTPRVRPTRRLYRTLRMKSLRVRNFYFYFRPLMIENGVPKQVQFWPNFIYKKKASDNILWSAGLEGLVKRQKMTLEYIGERRPEMALSHKRWLYVRTSNKPPRRVKTFLKQMVGDPFQSLSHPALERDLIRSLFSAAERYKDDPRRTTTAPIQSFKKEVETIEAGLKKLLDQTVASLIASLTSIQIDVESQLPEFLRHNASVGKVGSFLVLRSAISRLPTRHRFVAWPGSYLREKVVSKFDVPNGLTEEYLLKFHQGRHDDSDLVDKLQEFWHDWGKQTTRLELPVRQLWDHKAPSGAPEGPLPPKTAGERTLSNGQWMRNRLTVLLARNALLAATTAMYRSALLRTATYWLYIYPHERPWNEKARYHEYMLADSALLLEETQVEVERYGYLRERRILLPDVVLTTPGGDGGGDGGGRDNGMRDLGSVDVSGHAGRVGTETIRMDMEMILVTGLMVGETMEAMPTKDPRQLMRIQHRSIDLQADLNLDPALPWGMQSEDVRENAKSRLLGIYSEEELHWGHEDHRKATVRWTSYNIQVEANVVHKRSLLKGLSLLTQQNSICIENLDITTHLKQPFDPPLQRLSMAVRNIPTHNGPPAKSMLAPNQTLYLTNLPEKLRKIDLRLSLYTLFSTYGPVLDVVAMPGNKMRGQAWVAFRDTQASTQAMRALQAFDFCGRQMKIQYAKGKSDAIAKLDGTYRMPVAAGNAATSTDLQQQIFGAPPSGLPAPVKAQQPVGTNGGMELDKKEEESKGVKRGREEESDEEVAMDEDSDAPMEEGSDDDD